MPDQAISLPSLERKPATPETKTEATVKIVKLYNGGQLYINTQVQAMLDNPDTGFDNLAPKPREFGVTVFCENAEIGKINEARTSTPVVFTVAIAGRAENIKAWAEAFNNANAPGVVK